MAFHASCSETSGEAQSKFADVIKNSIQTAAEPIKTYLLNTAEEDLSEDGDGPVKRCTFGGKDPGKSKKTILMVGESSTGKSTLINMIINYMLDVQWEDKIRFEMIPNEGERLQTEPQTSVITAYEIHGLESLSVPFSLTVIDTPGFGGTDSPKKDELTAENLCMLFRSSKAIQQIDAVCLVVKASQFRLSPSQKYIFDTILSLFGKNMEKNIMILITFSDWTPPAALKVITESGVPFSKNENDEPVYFLFNSPPLQKFHKQHEEMFKTNWEDGTESFSKFFQALQQMKPQSTTMTINVLQERQSLNTYVQSLESHVKDVQRKREALEGKKKTLEELREDKRKNMKSQDEDPYPGWKMVKIEKIALFCNKCEVLCPCPTSWKDSLPFPVKKGPCSCKCGYDLHDANKEMYIPEDKKIIAANKDKDKKAENKIATTNEEISKLEQEFKSTEPAQAEALQRCFECIQQLREKALKFDSDAPLQSIRRLREILHENKDTENEKKLQQILLTTM